MTTLDSRVVLITGAGGGFGREMIRQFLRAGSFLVLADRELAPLHRAASEVASLVPPGRGRLLGYVAADLSTNAGCNDLFRQTQAITPHVDVLVNNAGIGVSGSFADIPPEHWERLMAINLLAPMRLTACFLPGMTARGSGHIVNVSSVAGLVGSPGMTAYSTSKWGLRGFGEAIGNEYAAHGIAVTTIYPFFSRTAILDSLHFGPERNPLPAWMVYEPAQVVAALIKGIQRNKRHVYPGAIPKVINLLARLVPWLDRPLTQPFNTARGEQLLERERG
jgi:short-subunit dehydrogenase